jgi:hypothetical protein
MEFAKIVAESDLVAKQLQGKPANVFMVVQKAVGLGISFDLACAQCHVIDNKVSPSAELLRILLRRAGHDLEIYEHNDKFAKARLTLCHRPDRPIEMEYSIAKAQAAGLTGKSVWKQHAESMLVAAVTRLLVRFHCPEVAAGLSLDVETADAEFSHDAVQEPMRVSAERVTGSSSPDTVDAGAASSELDEARMLFEQAQKATSVSLLTELGKNAGRKNLLDHIVKDGVTLRQALMRRLEAMEGATAN